MKQRNLDVANVITKHKAIKMWSFIEQGKNIKENPIYNCGKCNFFGKTITSLFNYNQ